MHGTFPRRRRYGIPRVWIWLGLAFLSWLLVALITSGALVLIGMWFAGRGG